MNVDIGEIKNNAPEGATHCYLDGVFEVVYCKVTKDKIYTYNGIDWDFFDYVCDIDEYDLKPL